MIADRQTDTHTQRQTHTDMIITTSDLLYVIRYVTDCV